MIYKFIICIGTTTTILKKVLPTCGLFPCQNNLLRKAEVESAFSVYFLPFTSPLSPSSPPPQLPPSPPPSETTTIDEPSLKTAEQKVRDGRGLFCNIIVFSFATCNEIFYGGFLGSVKEELSMDDTTLIFSMLKKILPLNTL